MLWGPFLHAEKKAIWRCCAPGRNPRSTAVRLWLQRDVRLASWLFSTSGSNKKQKNSFLLRFPNPHKLSESCFSHAIPVGRNLFLYFVQVMETGITGMIDLKCTAKGWESTSGLMTFAMHLPFNSFVMVAMHLPCKGLWGTLTYL